MDQVPTEILTLIFSKFSVKSLARIKCVCKLWSQIIDHGIPFPYEPGSMKDPALVVLAKSRHRKPTMIWKDGITTFLKISSCLFSEFAVSEGRYSLENSCHGLLCFRTKKKSRLACLLNPLTQQIIKLPPASTSELRDFWSFIKYGLGFDSVTATYKVVRVYHLVSSCDDGQRKCSNMNAQIYTFGFGFGKKSSSWRPITSIPPCPLNRASRAVSAGGFLHWVTRVTFSPEKFISEQVAFNKHKIVAFHLSKEEFRLISLPRSLFPSLVLSYHLVNLGGVLGLVDTSSRDMDIWTMKDYDKEEWVKTYSLKPPIFLRSTCNPPVMGPWENGKLLLKYCESLISCDPNANQWGYIYTLGLKDDKQSENDKLFLKTSSSTCSTYDPNTEKWIKTQIPPGYDDDAVICFYTESLLLISSFMKS